MATITEDYVSFEIAKLLKEKGFPQDYNDYHALVYNEEDYEDEYEVQRMVLKTRIVKAGTLSSYPIGVPEPKCYCCTLQMAMKWLREVYNLQIQIAPINSKYKDWAFGIYKDFSPLTTELTCCPTYEEACEEAVKYCLENLI